MRIWSQCQPQNGPKTSLNKKQNRLNIAVKIKMLRNKTVMKQQKTNSTQHKQRGGYHGVTSKGNQRSAHVLRIQTDISLATQQSARCILSRIRTCQHVCSARCPLSAMRGPAPAANYVFDCASSPHVLGLKTYRDLEAFREANPQVFTLPTAPPPSKSISAVIAMAVMLRGDVCVFGLVGCA